MHVPPWAAVVKQQHLTAISTIRIALRSPPDPISDVPSLNALDVDILDTRPAVPREAARTGIAVILDSFVAFRHVNILIAMSGV